MDSQASTVSLGLLFLAVIIAANVYYGVSEQPLPMDGVAISASFPYMDLEFLTKEADYIAIGSIKEERPPYVRQVQQGLSTVYTDYILEVESMLKAPSEFERERKAIVIRDVGGEVEGVSSFFSDSPDFQIGERVLVFLHQGQDVLATVGGWQGKYTLGDGKAISQDSKRNMAEAELLEKVENMEVSWVGF